MDIKFWFRIRPFEKYYTGFRYGYGYENISDFSTVSDNLCHVY